MPEDPPQDPSRNQIEAAPSFHLRLCGSSPLSGLFLLLPPILGVFAFVLQLFNADTDFSEMRNLSSDWTTNYGYDQGGGGGMSAAPVYLGLMAIAGVYLIKDSFYTFFIKDEQDKNKIAE